MKLVEYGFKSFNGVYWWNFQVDRYNKLTKKIQAREELGYCTEELLNIRNQQFKLFSNLEIV